MAAEVKALFNVPSSLEDDTGILPPDRELLFMKKELLNGLHPWMKAHFSRLRRENVGEPIVNGKGYDDFSPIDVTMSKDVGKGNFFLVTIGDNMTLSYILSPEIEGVERQLLGFNLNIVGVTDPFQALYQARTIVDRVTAH